MAEKTETIAQKMVKAIKAARGRITTNVTPDESQKVSQAVINLVQAKRQLDEGVGKGELEAEVAVLLDRVRPNLPPIDMMKASQAVLNLMQAEANVTEAKLVAKAKADKKTKAT